MKKIIMLGWMLLSTAWAEQPQIAVCFTPGNDCTTWLADMLAHAQKTVLVQAYTFTSKPIAEALVANSARGVDVKIIFDKSIMSGELSMAKFFGRHHIPMWVDFEPSIAHNKVMIIDDEYVITGSFNFTFAAQNKNAENVLIIHDAKLAARYTQNWHSRQNVSLVYQYKQEEDIYTAQRSPSRIKVENNLDKLAQTLKAIFFKL